MDISIFWGERFKKAPGAVDKWDPIFQKHIEFPIFLAKGKNLTPRQVEIPKMTLKGSALLHSVNRHTARWTSMIALENIFKAQ